MAKPPDSVFAEILNLALESEVGLGIETDDRRFLVAELHRVRKKLGFTDLIIISPPNPEEVWVCQKNQDLPSSK